MSQQIEKSHSDRSKKTGKSSVSHKAESASGTSKTSHQSGTSMTKSKGATDHINRAIVHHGGPPSTAASSSKSSSLGQRQRSKGKSVSAPTAISNIAGLTWSEKTRRSTLGPIHIDNLSKLHFLQKSVMHSRMTPAVKDSKSGKSGSQSSRSTARARVDPRAMKRNDNLPLEASAAFVIDQKEASPAVASGVRSGKFDDALRPATIYKGDVRLEFQAKVMRSLSGGIYDPLKFLYPVPASDKEKNYLERHVDPSKLIDFMVKHMKLYYDLEADPDAFSGRRQELDNYLWDNLAFIIPMLCRQVIDVFLTEVSLLFCSLPRFELIVLVFTSSQ